MKSPSVRYSGYGFAITLFSIGREASALLHPEDNGAIGICLVLLAFGMTNSKFGTTKATRSNRTSGGP